MVLIDFQFGEDVIVELLGPLFIWARHGLLFFTAISLADGTGVESRLDHWLLCNNRILSCL
jgi:hypothetical protein